MSTIDQITYWAPNGSTGIVKQAATSIRDQDVSSQWLHRLEPWLRTGRPAGRGYLDFGRQAAFIRWFAGRDSLLDWQYALVLVGQSTVLTSTYALELPGLDPGTVHAGNLLAPIARTERGPGHDAIEARARSADAAELLIPLLAHALQGERRVTMPWTEPSLAEAVMWGLVSVLGMIGDTRPVSFLTYANAPSRAADTPGLFVSFRPGASVMPPDLGFEELAGDLAARFADDPHELRLALARNGMLEPADPAGRITRLLTLWPRVQAGTRPGENAVIQEPGSRPSRGAQGQVVVCPICLSEIEDWHKLGFWRWDASRGEYAELPVSSDLNERQRVRFLRGAHVRCPAPQDTEPAHYLPVNYGRFGRPVLLGFAGLTKSGKSHLLASMVGAIENRELEAYGITSRPIDHARHQRFLEEWVNPLISHNKVLHGTREGIVEFADAFLMSYQGGPERPVALFDVAGGDLARVDETNQFLWIADGLFFVIDPDHMITRRVGDETFSNVLDVIRESAHPGPVSAAIILNKADKLRFDEPVTRWLRSESKTLDAAEFLRESADVYAYLHAKEAGALAGPYQVCDKATLHVASPTGGSGDGEGGVYPRGVTPRRVLRPLVAMLAMTGVLTGPEAEQVGV
jgi:hypothetical protein